MMKAGSDESEPLDSVRIVAYYALTVRDLFDSQRMSHFLCEGGSCGNLSQWPAAEAVLKGRSLMHQDSYIQSYPNSTTLGV